MMYLLSDGFLRWASDVDWDGLGADWGWEKLQGNWNLAVLQESQNVTLPHVIFGAAT